MPQLLRGLAAMVACLAATACAIPAERIDDREGLIAAAGFDVRPANTREWQASLRNLPSSHFVQQARSDRLR